MEITLQNLGALEYANFSLGDLTIICGKNNTGKTYATYALFCFLSFWKNQFEYPISDDKIKELLFTGKVEIDLQDCINELQQVIKTTCNEYTKLLPSIFASEEKKFENSSFEMHLDFPSVNLNEKYNRVLSSGNKNEVLSISKEEGNSKLIISFLVTEDKAKFPQQIITKFVGEALKDILLPEFLPNPFIVSAERTGAAIFRKELNFARNRLLEEISSSSKDINPLKLIFNVTNDYALPVKMNVEFTRNLEQTFKSQSFIVKEYPEIINNFLNIIGGDYLVTKNDELYFSPAKKKIKLTMDESSSGVRSALDLGFYLKHVAQKGDLLIVDEPELNLHPENQRKIARLFAQLVNIGIKVFITTHSDYIVRELNTLIMLNSDKPHIKKIQQEEGYTSLEILDYSKVKVYIAEQAKIPSKHRKVNTLTEAPIDKNGIEVKSFDETIEKINQIQEAIVWGE